MLTAIAVEDVMRTPVETIRPERSVRAAADRLSAREIGSLIVCENGQPVGILTDVDLTRLIAEGGDPETTPVEAVMGAPLVSVRADAPIETAAELMREHEIKRLPVLADGRVVGIVTTTDLSNFLPHLVRMGRDQSPPADRDRHRVRVDTAYTRDDWEFAYLGDEESVEVGDTVRFSKALSEADVEAFAEASGDTNRLHLDEEFARSSRFGEPIAHGTLVVGVVSAALARLPGLVIYLSQDVSYLGPVPIGRRVTAECEVLEDLGKGRYRLSTAVRVGSPEPAAVADGETTDAPDGAEAGGDRGDEGEGENAGAVVVDGEAVVLIDDVPT